MNLILLMYETNTVGEIDSFQAEFGIIGKLDGGYEALLFIVPFITCW